MKRILLSLLAAFLPGSLLAQGQQLYPYNVEFDHTVRLSLISWNGQVCLAGWWVPRLTGYHRLRNYTGKYFTFVEFHNTSPKVSLTVEAIGLLHWTTGPRHDVVIEEGITPLQCGREVGHWAAPDNPTYIYQTAPAAWQTPPVLQWQPSGVCYPSTSYSFQYGPYNWIGYPGAPDIAMMVFSVQFL